MGLFLGRSNNTNKLSPQEHVDLDLKQVKGSNNTNKLSPQELLASQMFLQVGSNNTNKLSPQELSSRLILFFFVQIIQINLVLKNPDFELYCRSWFK